MNVGDYVRTKKGEIVKIIDKKFDDTLLIDLYTTDKKYYLMEIDIFKSSPNIIDLIEVGDYVNGMQVTRICFDEDGQRILNLSNCILELMNEDIKSTVTKEQFSQMEYKVGK